MAGSAESVWNLGGLSFKQLGKEAASKASEADITGRAAQLAYYFFLALFPLMLFVLSALALAAGSNSALQQNLMNSLARFAPADAANLIRRTVEQTFHAAGGWKAALGLVGALWSASSGVSALMDTLNSAFETKETRSYVKRTAISLWMTVAGSVLVLAAIGLLLVGQEAAQHFASAGALGPIAKWAWIILQWPLLIFLMLVAFATIYYFAPNVEHPAWHWVTPGSAVGVTLWLVASFALRVYLHYFNTYSKTYGALTAVIIVLLWFYLTGLVILLGGVINSIIEHAVSQQPGEAEMKKPSPSEPETKPTSKAA
ncbi:MAG TPA: YihY/virulence factor BrkB family protein [Terriglobales bacterium]|nr:YihY/virulence factor BrkB family protein [Terriglobales bacterium]